MSVFYPKNEPKMSQGLSYGLSEDGSNHQKNIKTKKVKKRLSSYLQYQPYIYNNLRTVQGQSEDKSKENPDITITITNTIYI